MCGTYGEHHGKLRELRVRIQKEGHADVAKHAAEQGHSISWYLPTMGEGAYLSSEAVMEQTTDKNMHCEDAGKSAEKWHECYEAGGDYLDGYKGGAPAKSAALPAHATGAVLMTLILSQFY